MKLKGIIALDMDGTLTHHTHHLDPDVAEYISNLAQDGWQFVFLTGRPYNWAIKTIENLPFTYYLAVQNGALTLYMPTKDIVSKHYLSIDVLPEIEKLCQKEGTGMVVYGGYEQEDRCYYRKADFDKELETYLKNRCEAIQEEWFPIEQFNELPMTEFPSIKFFAREEQAQRLSQKLEEDYHLHAPFIRDPFNASYFVIQATRQDADKGHAINAILALQAARVPLIAAGDDYNDRSLLQKADVKIAMASAPMELRADAHIVAPSAKENGIILGLKRAIGFQQ